MVFQADTAFAVILIALGIGFWVLVKARSPEGGDLKGFGTFLGYFIIILSFLVLLGASYYSARYWEDGYFAKPATQGAMMGSMSMHDGGSGVMAASGMHAGRHEMMKNKMHSDSVAMKAAWNYCPYCGMDLKAAEKPSEMHDNMGGMMEEDDHEMNHDEDDK